MIIDNTLSDGDTGHLSDHEALAELNNKLDPLTFPTGPATIATADDVAAGDAATLAAAQTHANNVVLGVVATSNVVQKNAVSGTYTWALDDLGKVVEATGPADVAVIIPSNADVPLPLGALLEVHRNTAAEVRIQAAAGVALHSPVSAVPGPVEITTRNGTAVFRQREIDEWVAEGLIAPATVSLEFMQTVPNLGLWLRADVLTAADGTQVAQWDDMSGNNRHAVQPTLAFRPTVLENAQNGKRMLRFVEAEDRRLEVAGYPIDGLTGMTMLAVVKFPVATGHGSVISWPNNDGLGTELSPSRAQISYRFGTDTGHEYTDQYFTDVGVAAYLAGAIKDGANEHARRDGAQEGGLDGGQITPLAGNGTTATIAFNDKFDYYGSFDLGELVVFDRALSGTELADVEADIMTRWALA